MSSPRFVTWRWMGAAVLLFLAPAFRAPAQDFSITYQQTGSLTWDNAGTGLLYKVMWADDLSGSWALFDAGGAFPSNDDRRFFRVVRLPASGGEPPSGGGMSKFDGGGGGASAGHKVEWADDVEGPWSNSWSHLSGVLAVSGKVSVAVPPHSRTLWPTVPALNPANGHYYQLAGHAVTWHQAKNAADEVFYGMTGHLATVESEQENEFLVSLLLPEVDGAWLGGTDQDEEGVWTWITGESWSFTRWRPGQPDNTFPKENYLVMIGPRWEDNVYTGYWADASGSREFNINFYLIEWTPASNQTPSLNVGNGHYYQVFLGGISWSQACSLATQTLFQGMAGHLATITSPEENDFVADLLPSGVVGAWLGGTDNSSEGAWSWITPEGWSYGNWGAGQPDDASPGEDYLAMLGPAAGTGTWFDATGLACAEVDAYVVEWTPPSAGPVRNPLNGHYYQIVEGVLSWAEANEIATHMLYLNMTGYLATITSVQEQNLVFGLMNTAHVVLWIGGRDTVSEGTWTWVTGEPWTYANWYPGEPNNQYGNEDYLVIFGPGDVRALADGRWNDENGQPQAPIQHFIVEWSPPEPPGPVLNPENGHYYQFIPAACTWADAVAGAGQIYSGMTGYLAGVTSASENSFVLSILPADNVGAWIGGTDSAAEGDWRWLTGEAWGYENWYSGEPDGEDYLVFFGYGNSRDSAGGTWNDAVNNDAEPQGYVIEWGADYPGPTNQIQYDPRNGHGYLVVTGALSWCEAVTAAQICVNNVTGHLGTITCQAENDFVSSLLTTQSWCVWLGGTDTNTEGAWEWITGETWCYENWYPPEPNNQFPGEHYLMMYGPPELHTLSIGRWNDTREESVIRGYVVEWDYPGESRIPTLFPTNGHYYQVVECPLAWTDASNSARVVFNGMTGYLATATSQAENQFILGLIGLWPHVVWIGGSDVEQDHVWTWITGEPWSYANWHPGEPNNDDGQERYLWIFSSGEENRPGCAGKWNDARDLHAEVGGYVIEWGAGEEPPGCVFTNPITYNADNGHYYQMVECATTWIQASNDARVVYNGMTGYLAIVTSEAENTFIRNLIASYPHPLWIGGSDVDLDHAWVWNSGDAFDWTNWATNEPNNDDGVERYLWIFTDADHRPGVGGQWNDARNDHPEIGGYMIEWGDYTSGPDTGSVTCNSENGHCYQVVSGVVTWAAASNTAAGMIYSGMTGHLATITSSQEQAFVYSLFNTSQKVVWLGGSDAAVDGTWTWITGESWVYENWADGEPNGYGDENCLAIFAPGDLRPQGGWNDESGTAQTPIDHFVVEWSPP